MADKTVQDEQAQRQAAAQADLAAQQERTQDAQRRVAEDAAQVARDDAERASAAADALAERAQRVADAEELVTVDITGNGVSVRRADGSRSPFYGPGKGIQVPRYVAEAIGASPTFATSGDRAADAGVRRKLETLHGIDEAVTQEETTHRMSAHSEDAPTGEETPDNQRKAGASSRARGAGKEPLSRSAIDELGAEEVDRRYEKGVRAGRVKPVADGKGSGADGAVLKADKVDALHAAGESE